ncbi:hypothetical protein [Halobacteriovorax sp. YZS-1-1]|uniref:hypothetical protein n=1 Tax=unclassified Halobacteriovorax TaxID=2639665 RepID=UPI00399AD7B4
MSSQFQINNKFVKAISLLCFIFGASQMILLGLLPMISEATNLNITTIIIFYGLSIFHFLLMTRVWGNLFNSLSPVTVYRVGLFGIFFSYGFLLLAFLVSSPIAAFGLFIISRIIHASTASSIVPFSQLINLRFHTKSSDGVLNTTMFLNIGRLFGLILGGVFAFNLSMSLVILMVFIIAVSLNGWERAGKGILLCEKDYKEESDEIKDKKVRFKPLFLIPLFFTLISSFYNTGITKAVSSIFEEATKQSATIYWSLTLATLCLVLIQFIIKKYKLLESYIFITFGVVSLIASFYAFTLITSITTLVAFILLFAIGAAIIPVYYMGFIYGQYVTDKKSIVASKISFYQTLGNAIGAISAGTIIKLNLDVYIIFIFSILTFFSVYMIVKNSRLKLSKAYVGVSND